MVEPAGFEHQDELRRDRAEHGDLMSSHGFDRCGRIESSLQDGRHAQQRWGKVLGPEAEAEGRGQGTHEDIIISKVPDLSGKAVEMKPTELIVDHDFRQARRTGGRVEEGSLVRC